MASPTRYAVGDKVTVTDAALKIMHHSNRSCVTPMYPSDSFIAKAKACKGRVGEVMHVFPPGYEVTVAFLLPSGWQAFHMKDNWIEPIVTEEAKEVLSRADASSLAYQWHGGMGSPLYRFACWGGYIQSEDHRTALQDEINANICSLEGYPSEERTQEGPKLLALLDYIDNAPIEAAATTRKAIDKFVKHL